MDLTKAPDSDLVTLYLVDSSEEAFEVIYNRYNDSLLDLVIRYRFFCMADIEDILQNVWRKVILHLTSFDLELSLRNWLYKVAENAAIYHYIYQNRIQRGGREIVLPLLELAEEVVEYDCRVGRRETNPAKLLFIKDYLERVLEAIECLPKQDRDILHYVCIDGLTRSETIELMGIAKHTLQSSLNRSRVTLAKVCA